MRCIRIATLRKALGTLAIAGTITLAIAGTAHADIPFSHAVNGHATYYNDAGYGACGTQINAASQRLVAVPRNYWSSLNPNSLSG